MHQPPDLVLADSIGPVIGAVVFILVMSMVKEPARRTFNAVLVAGATGVYLGAGFGIWEVPYLAVVFIAYLGLRSYRYIGLAWLLHAGWDLMHHLYGDPIWPFVPTSSYGCMIFDTVIAIWLLAGAPFVGYRLPQLRTSQD